MITTILKGKPKPPPSVDEDFKNFLDEVNRLETILARLKSHAIVVTKQDLDNAVDKIMGVIKDFADKQAAFNTRIGTAIDGVGADVLALNKKIEELQNSPGTISPEDQALLDSLQAQGEALASRLEALDAMTPPVPPPVPPTA